MYTVGNSRAQEPEPWGTSFASTQAVRFQKHLAPSSAMSIELRNLLAHRQTPSRCRLPPRTRCGRVPSAAPQDSQLRKHSAQLRRQLAQKEDSRDSLGVFWDISESRGGRIGRWPTCGSSSVACSCFSDGWSLDVSQELKDLLHQPLASLNVTYITVCGIYQTCGSLRRGRPGPFPNCTQRSFGPPRSAMRLRESPQQIQQSRVTVLGENQQRFAEAGSNMEDV